MSDGLLHELTTEYDYYTVVEEHYNGRPARVLYSKERIAAQSGIALDGKDELLFDYNERFMELFRALDPARVLVIGGGAFTLPLALLEEKPELVIDIVEIDEGLVRIATDYFNFKPSELTNVFIGDGQAYLRQRKTRYDLIIVDAFMGSAMPPALQRTEFARSLMEHLNKKGVVAINIISALHGQRSQVLRRELNSLQTVFHQIEIFPAGHDISPWIPQNFVVTATNQNRSFEPYLRYVPVSAPARP